MSRPAPESSPEELVRMHATVEARRHSHVTTFASITDEERQYHARLAEVWDKVAAFVEELKP